MRDLSSTELIGDMSMKESTRDKTALVTGGSSGIGKSIALKFAQHGYDVAITYSTSKQRVERVLTELEKTGRRATAIQTNFLESGAIEKAFEEFDRHFDHLDVLINNAGWTKYIPHEDLSGLTNELFDKIVTVNLKSVFFCIQHGIKRMKRDDSCIVNITSIAAYSGIGSNIAYCAAKAGVTSMTKSLARALGPKKIRVNSIAPGLTETKMTDSSPPSYRDEQIRATPLGRIATPQDIANATYALVHEMKFVNGKTIIADGGRLL